MADGVRLYAIGDIHGRLDLFELLLARIADDHAARPSARRVTVLLGDLIDRGPDSFGVVERVIQLRDQEDEVITLLGNHEEVFLQALSGDVEALKFLIRMGGKATLNSYGLDDDEYDALDWRELGERLRAMVPEHHVAFLGGLEDLIEYGDYAFVHAGVRPGLQLDRQTGKDLRWIRAPFLEHERPHPSMIVHGHSITDDVDIRSNRIGLDTGAYASGILSAIGLEDERMWILDTRPR